MTPGIGLVLLILGAICAIFIMRILRDLREYDGCFSRIATMFFGVMGLAVAVVMLVGLVAALPIIAPHYYAGR